MDSRVALKRYPIKPLNRITLILGWLCLTVMLAATVFAFLGLLNFSGHSIKWQFIADPYFFSIVKFTLLQAGLSAILSALFAWPIALALLYLKNSLHKKLFLSLCILCFVMPTLVLITGIVSLYGNSGLLSQWLGIQWNIYGLPGILIAHIYLNMPFAIRSIYLRLNAIPENRWKLALQLKLNRWQRFKILEWPAAQSITWLVTGFIFVLCFNSFSVVLALGGGPKSTTLEVAIYQALKYDFNIPEALVLAWIQLFIAGGLYLMVTTFGNVKWLGNETVTQKIMPTPRKTEQKIYLFIYWFAWAVLLAPLLTLIPKAFGSYLNYAFLARMVSPTLYSLLIAVLATFLSVFMAYMVLKPYRRALSQRSTSYIWIDGLGSHALVVPAMVLSVGLFTFFIRRVDMEACGFYFVVVINALVSIPFAISQLKAPLVNYDQQYSRLSKALKLTAGQRFVIEFKFVRPAIQTSAAFVSVLVLGDVAIYSIFGNQDFVTLPWLIYNFASTYRLNEAAVVSLILLLMSGLITVLLEQKRTYYSEPRPQ